MCTSEALDVSLFCAPKVDEPNSPWIAIPPTVVGAREMTLVPASLKPRVSTVPGVAMSGVMVIVRRIGVAFAAVASKRASALA